MKRKRTILSLFVVLCFAVPHLVYGGAWTVPKGKMWVEETGTYRFAKYDFNSNRDYVRKSRNAESYGWDATTKGEYGIFDWLSLIGGITYKEAHYTETNRPAAWGVYDTSNHAFTNAEGGVKIRFMKDPIVFTGQVKIQSYIGGKKYTDPIPGSYTHASADRPQMDDGVTALELRGLIGKKFDWAIPCYFGAETGYRFKNRSLCNDIPFFAEAGFWPTYWMLIKGEVDGYWCHDGTGSIEKEYAIWRVGPVIRLLGAHKGKAESGVTREGQFLDLTIQYGDTFWGRNVSKDHMIIAKIAAQF